MKCKLVCAFGVSGKSLDSVGRRTPFGSLSEFLLLFLHSLHADFFFLFLAWNLIWLDQPSLSRDGLSGSDPRGVWGSLWNPAERLSQGELWKFLPLNYNNNSEYLCTAFQQYVVHSLIPCSQWAHSLRKNGPWKRHFPGEGNSSSPAKWKKALLSKGALALLAG